MQRPTQRPMANATSASLPKLSKITTSTVSAAAYVEVPVVKASIVSQSRTSIRKRRTHVKDRYVLMLDQHIILRTLILFVTCLCCFVAWQSLSGDGKETYSKHALRSREDLEKGKERIIQLLKEAGIIDLDFETLSRLPTWEEVTYVYIFPVHCLFLVKVMSHMKYNFFVS